MRAGADKPPYFCHYMAWRLGTWNGEGSFEVLDELLAFGAGLENWQHQRSLLLTCDYSTFWSLLWQLQVARFVAIVADNVSWLKSGPDIVATLQGERLYIECFVYKKSFGISQYVAELFKELDFEIRVEHSWFLPFSLPKNAETSAFLDKLFAPFLDDSYLGEKHREAMVSNPVILNVPPEIGNLHIWLGRSDGRGYVAGIVDKVPGDPEHYLQLALREGVDAKRNANKLSEHRLNLLAINFALSQELEVGWSRQIRHGWPLPTPDLGAELDAVLVAWSGINEVPTRHTVQLFAPDGRHPAWTFFGSARDVE
ncbi:MAG: hypothetical protein HYR85_14695 [Planctomycetes bacterium]|nr:hypothetical protein [Planctomycetota bacterium]MBI3843232.1 hypothetical protein [Planctomycetota bacterium]